jgi:hypothetical protein
MLAQAFGFRILQPAAAARSACNLQLGGSEPPPGSRAQRPHPAFEGFRNPESHFASR